MRLLVATRSRGKQPEIRRLLEAAGHAVVFPDEAGIRIPSGHDRSGTSAGALTKAHDSQQGLPKEAMMPTDTARKAEEARSPIQIPPGV